MLLVLILESLLHPFRLSFIIFLGEKILKNQVEQLFSFEDLGNNVVVICCFVKFVDFEDISMVKFLEHFYLLETGESSIHSLLYRLECSLELKSLMLDSINGAKRSLSDFPSHDIMVIKATNSAHNKVFAINTHPLGQFVLFRTFRPDFSTQCFSRRFPTFHSQF